MLAWLVEKGTLWALESGDQPPPLRHAQATAQFAAAASADVPALAAAMGLPGPEPIYHRLRAGRRCLLLKVGGQIAAYGWVTRGTEFVGELERQFNLRADEAYIWDCRTMPEWQRQGFYSALLSQAIRHLQDENVSRIWIGASRDNMPSIRGFANAGFRPVVDVTYRRLYRLTLMWVQRSPSTSPPLAAAAYRILVTEHERRVGPLVVGYRHR